MAFPESRKHPSDLNPGDPQFPASLEEKTLTFLVGFVRLTSLQTLYVSRTGDPALSSWEFMASWVELLAARKHAHDAAGLGDNIRHSLDRRWALDHSAAAAASTSAPTAMPVVMIRRPTAFG